MIKLYTFLLNLFHQKDHLLPAIWFIENEKHVYFIWPPNNWNNVYSGFLSGTVVTCQVFSHDKLVSPPCGTINQSYFTITTVINEQISLKLYINNLVPKISTPVFVNGVFMLEISFLIKKRQRIWEKLPLQIKF
jgi:hypothetical protein